VSALEGSLSAETGLRLRTLELAPLAEGPERELARSLLGASAPEEIIEEISQGTDGNPLFLEQRFSSLVETGALSRDEAGWHLDPSRSSGVPEALERLVRSRVDRLRPGPRDAIVAASVLGPEFALGALSAVCGPEGALSGAVSELCSAGLLLELPSASGPAYRFRHALIQEAIYTGLLREQRRHLHAKAAWGLEAASAGRLEEVASVLGHHYAMAGEAERAAHWLEVAGDHAASGFASDEAIASYRHALELVRDRAPTDMGQTAAQLAAKLAQVLFWRGQFAQARDVAREGLATAPLHNPAKAARLYAVLGGVELHDHHFDAALAAFDAAEELIGDYSEEMGPRNGGPLARTTAGRPGQRLQQPQRAGQNGAVP